MSGIVSTTQKQWRDKEMMNTYFGTQFREVKNSIVFVDVFDRCRYNSNIRRENILETLEFDGTVTHWDIIEGGREADEIERRENISDEYREYLVLHFTDNTTRSFPNSHVSMDMI